MEEGNTTNLDAQTVAEEVTATVVKNLKPDLPAVIMVISFAILVSCAIEAIGWYKIYQTDEYKDLVEKIDNMSKRLKEMRNSSLYGQGSKKRQSDKLLKINEQTFRDYHRELAGVSTLNSFSNFYLNYFGVDY
jgi:hypothetical protein